MTHGTEHRGDGLLDQSDDGQATDAGSGAAGEGVSDSGKLGDGVDRGVGAVIELPFPPASLSGHNTGNFFAKSPIVAKHRTWAELATRGAGAKVTADEGDIPVSVTFHAPDNRGDRVNYPNRMKPYWDGIADALRVNDRRFLPSYHFGPNEKPGRVVVSIGGAI